MQRNRDGGRDLVRFKKPRYADGEQGFHAPQGRESKKNSDGRAERDRVRRISQRHQRHVMGRQPFFRLR